MGGEAEGGEEFEVAGGPFADFRFGENVGEGDHAFAVADFGEFVEGLAGDALGGGVGSDEVGIGLLQLGEFVLQGVGSGLGHNRFVQDVVMVAVIVDELAEFLDAGGGGGVVGNPESRGAGGG